MVVRIAVEDLPSEGQYGPRYYDRQGRPMGEWEWIRYFGSWGYKQVRESYVRGYRVSTVWLGLDHGIGFMTGGPPVIFETMIFGPEDLQEQWRYTSELEAVDGHYRLLEILLYILEAHRCDVRGWLELTGWNRRSAVEAG